jgi:hypothetical protein
MRTPAGKECRYYYADFHRGRNHQECRLIGAGRGSLAWQPRDCSNCPVPDILWANASPHLALRGRVVRGLLGLGRRVEVTATCSKHQCTIEDPHVGCAKCNAERPNLAALPEEGHD